MDVATGKIREALCSLAAPVNLDVQAKLAFELCKWQAITKLDDLLRESILEYEEYLSQQHMEGVDDPMY